MADVLDARIGEVALPNPVMTASGTYGLGTEFAAYGDPAALGALVVKSLSAEPWPGNPPPRLHPVSGGSMINAVGLQNPGVEDWARHGLAALRAAGARVVASLWGRTVAEYRAAARALAGVAGPLAWEVNLSCPNLEDPRHMFAHDPSAAAEVIATVAAEAAVPVWAKLSPNASDVVDIAAAVQEAGAAAVTLVNTLSGMAIDVERRAPVLAHAYGGVSGPAVHPVAVRAVHQVHHHLPGLPVIGAGGVGTGRDAVELMMAGASAVQVGTASFHDPRAPHRVLGELDRWLNDHGTTAAEIVGVVA